MSIKDDSELQHALAHIWNAIDHVAKGEKAAALYELDSVEGLIFFNNEAERLEHLERLNYGEEKEPMPGSATEAAHEEASEAGKSAT
jgi:hypothetical protein